MKPEALAHANVVRVDPDGNGEQATEFLAAHRAKRIAGLCGITITGDEFDQYDDNACIVTENGKARLVRRLDDVRHMIYPLKHLRANRFELLGTARQQVVVEPWPID